MRKFFEFLLSSKDYFLKLDSFSPEKDTAVAGTIRSTPVDGKLKVFNTINEFNVLDKNKFLTDSGNDVTNFLFVQPLKNKFC